MLHLDPQKVSFDTNLNCKTQHKTQNHSNITNLIIFRTKETTDDFPNIAPSVTIMTVTSHLPHWEHFSYTNPP
jgi:hypothetical protein